MDTLICQRLYWILLCTVNSMKGLTWSEKPHLEPAHPDRSDVWINILGLYGSSVVLYCRMMFVLLEAAMQIDLANDKQQTAALISYFHVGIIFM